MWQCQNCGYSDETGNTFDEEVDSDNPEEVVRYCPECGSDEVFMVDDDDDVDEDDDDEEYEEDDDYDDEEYGSGKDDDDDEW